MRHLKLILAILFAVTSLSATGTDSKYNIAGVWTDRYHDQRIEIKHGYDGIEVRKRGLFRKTRRFYKVGYNEFSDNNGNIIKIVSSSKLVWKNNRNRSYDVFYRYNDRNYYGNNYQNRNQSYGQSRYDRNYRNRSDNYNHYGSWYNCDGNGHVTLERYGDGFKIKQQGRDRWITYSRDKYEPHVYVSSYGDSYIFKDDYLVWTDKNGYDTTRFRRR